MFSFYSLLIQAWLFDQGTGSLVYKLVSWKHKGAVSVLNGYTNEILLVCSGYSVYLNLYINMVATHLCSRVTAHAILYRFYPEVIGNTANWQSFTCQVEFCIIGY